MAQTRRMDRQAFLAKRANARTHGFEFALPEATILNDGEPFIVRIRRLNLDEKAAVNGIPDTVQAEVYRRTRAIGDWHAKQQKANKSLAEQAEDARGNSAIRDALDAVMWAVMIDPPVVERESEVDSTPDAWHVDDFTLSDKLAVFMAATQEDSKEARSLKLFRPESDDDAADAGLVPVAAVAE